MSGDAKVVSRFAGMSMLRAEERKKDPAAVSAQASAMQAYLKRYADGPSEGEGEKKKRKKKKAPTSDGGAIRIIDEDVRAQAPVGRRKGPASDEEEDEDFKPVIANEAEVKLMIKQEQEAKEFYKRKADGSGWAAVNDSPPRRGARHDSPDASPPRHRARHDSPDASPPRQRARHDSPDASPPRRRARHDSPDASPPRQRARHDSPDASPPRQPARHDSPVASPPRQRARHDSPDASPPRRRARHDSPDASPPRQRARHDSPDASPPRQRAQDASPPRRPGGRMADGTAAGLVSAKQLAEEAARLKAEAEKRRLAATGKDAETVYRDRVTGKIISKEEFEKERSKGSKKDKEQEEVHLEWKQGLAQRRKAEEIAARLQEEAQAPFARYENDRERDAILKQRSRFGDPMAGLVSDPRSTSNEPESITARYNSDKLQQSGFNIPQGIPAHSWLKRGVPPSANRYDIRPGRHWDGVDRSNGFEKEMFKHQATVRHREAEARAWAQSDM